MRSGTLVGVGIGVATAVAAIAAYSLQTSFYERVEGLDEIEIGGDAFAVSDYQGLDNDARPLRLRGCFVLDDPAAAIAAGPPADEPVPFNAPSWFECWDAAELDADLSAGRATAVVAETAGEGRFATERVVAIYPDGRAFMWRRLIDDE